MIVYIILSIERSVVFEGFLKKKDDGTVVCSSEKNEKRIDWHD